MDKTSLPYRCLPPPRGGERLSFSNAVSTLSTTLTSIPKPPRGERLSFSRSGPPPHRGEHLILRSSNSVTSPYGDDHPSFQSQSKRRKVETSQRSENQLHMSNPIVSSLRPIAPTTPLAMEQSIQQSRPIKRPKLFCCVSLNSDTFRKAFSVINYRDSPTSDQHARPPPTYQNNHIFVGNQPHVQKRLEMKSHTTSITSTINVIMISLSVLD